MDMKKYIIFALAIVVMGLLPMQADAFSIQVRGGGGGWPDEQSYNSYAQESVGVDIFLYEGRNLELFFGGEHLEAITIVSDFFNSGESPADLSLKQTAVTYGMHLKPAMSGRWRPYLMLGGVSGRADFEIKNIDNNEISILSKTKDSTTFTAGRGGIGVDIGISQRLSLGMEANATYGVPYFKAVIGSLAYGLIEEDDLGSDWYIGLNLGLRYAF